MLKSKNIFAKEKRVLLIFLLIASLFWMMKNLTKLYTFPVKYPIGYVNIPDGKKFQTPPDEFLKIYIKTDGFSMLWQLIFSKKLHLDLSKGLKTSKYEYILVVSDMKPFLQKQLASHIVLERFDKKFLSCYLGAYQTKKVAIQPNVVEDYKLGYGRLGAIKAVPDSVILKGAQMLLDTLQFVRTQKITLSNVSEDFQQEVDVAPLQDAFISYQSIPKTTLSFKVVKFTEGAFQLPFQIINLPQDTNLIIKPKQVTLYYKVPLSDFSKVQKTDFKIICDYKQTADSDLNFMIPIVKEQSKNVKSIRITPEKIHFLVQEK